MNNDFEWKKVGQSAFGLNGKYCFAFWYVARSARTFAAHEHYVLRLRGRSAQYRAQTARKSFAKSFLIEQRMFDLCMHDLSIFVCLVRRRNEAREKSSQRSGGRREAILYCGTANNKFAFTSPSAVRDSHSQRLNNSRRWTPLVRAPSIGFHSRALSPLAARRRPRSRV